MNREQLLKLHEEKSAKSRKLMQAKNHDYTGAKGDDPFFNLRFPELLGLYSTERGIAGEIVKKLCRLAKFAEEGVLLVKDESIEDTCLDLINYAVLFMAWIQDKKSRMTQAGEEDA